MLRKITHSLIPMWLAALLLLTSCQIAPLTPTAGTLPSNAAPATPDDSVSDNAGQDFVQEEVTFESGDVTLAGTLTLPAESGPHPAAVLLTGSGPQNRDNGAPDLPDYQPYRQLAAELARRGIATLRYDDRGVGGSTGEAGTALASQLLDDAAAALAYLQTRPEIDPAQIGMLGHSQGGIIAAMLAAQQPELAFVVALATPALSGYETVKDSLNRLTESMDIPADMARQAAQRELAAMDLALAEEWDALEAHLTEAILAPLQDLTEEQRAAVGDLDALVEEQVARALETYQSARFRDEMRLDPASFWSQVDVPVLALYAEHEASVFAETHAPVLAELLDDNPDVTISTVPGVNHLFMEADTGNPQEWPNLPQAVPERVLTRIGEWLTARVDARN